MSEQARRERAALYEQMAAGGQVSDIPPALTASEWRTRRSDRPSGNSVSFASVPDGDDPDSGRSLLMRLSSGDVVTVADVGDLAALIALANDALNDEDPRKFRREHAELLRDVAETCQASFSGETDDRYALLNELADVIESYLPPQAS